MDRRRSNGPLFLLEQEVLTPREKQFVEAVKRYFFEHGKLTEQQESILKGIYKEKIWMRKFPLSQNHLSKGSSTKIVSMDLTKEGSETLDLTKEGSETF
jgi:uncharacterized membrane-anchored protein